MHPQARWRERTGTTQRHLADAAKLTQSFVSRLEKDKEYPTGLAEAALLCIAQANLSDIEPCRIEDYLPSRLRKIYLEMMEIRYGKAKEDATAD